MPAPAYSLSKFADLLVKFPETTALRKTIKTWLGFHSVRRDLITVNEYLTEARRFHREGTSESDNLIAGGLVNAALVMYARATETQSSRPRINVKRFYDADQMDAHHHLIDVRDHVMAHFEGKTGAGGAEWIEEEGVLLVVGSPENFKGAMRFKRATFLAHEVDDLFDLVAYILPHLISETDRKFERIKTELKRADGCILELLQECEIDVSALGLPAPNELQPYTGVLKTPSKRREN